MTREEILEIAKPILFNTDMVWAILDDRKSVTRRVLKPQPILQDNLWLLDGAGWSDGVSSVTPMPGHSLYKRTPYKPGDYLYIRETWCNANKPGCEPDYYYYADTRICEDYDSTEWKWSPSIHMPKEAARIFLRVTDVRVERLQDISEEQSIHEGICRLYDYLSDDEYSEWASSMHINAQKSEWGWKNYLWHGHFGKHGTGNAISNAWKYQYSSYDDPVGSFSSLWNSTLPLNQWDKYGWDASPWVWVIEFERVEVDE